MWVLVRKRTRRLLCGIFQFRNDLGIVLRESWHDRWLVDQCSVNESWGIDFALLLPPHLPAVLGKRLLNSPTASPPPHILHNSCCVWSSYRRRHCPRTTRVSDLFYLCCCGYLVLGKWARLHIHKSKWKSFNNDAGGSTLGWLSTLCVTCAPTPT